MTKVTFTPADPETDTVYNGYDGDVEFQVAAGESVDVSAETAARLKDDHPVAFGGKAPSKPAAAKAPVDPDAYNRDELAAMATERDLATSGTKQELADAINEHDAGA